MIYRSEPLGEIATIEREGIAPESIKSGARYVGLEHIDGTGALQDVSVINGELASTKFSFGPEHILFGKLRPYLRKIARPEFSGICSTDIIPIKPSAKIDRGYLFHFLRLDETVSKAASLATGVNLPRLSPHILETFEVPLPPLHDQRRIAAILDQAADLRRKRREASQRLNLLGAAIFLNTFGRPRLNPFSFKSTKLGDIVNFVGGSQPPKSTFLYEDGPNRVRFVQIRDFTSDEYKTYIPAPLAKRPFETDDVMIGRYGPPVFQIFRGLSGSYNVALMKAEPRPGILKDFVYYLLQEKELHSFVVANSERTAGQSGVNLALLDAYPAYFPSLELQQTFAAQVASIENLKACYSAHLAKLDALFASLQHRAFRGEL